MLGLQNQDIILQLIDWEDVWSLKVCGILKKWDLKNEKVLYLYTLIKYCIKYLLHSTPIAKLVYVWHI